MRPPDAERGSGEWTRAPFRSSQQTTGTAQHTPPRYDLIGTLDRIADELHGLRNELARIAITVDAVADYGIGVRS